MQLMYHANTLSSGPTCVREGAVYAGEWLLVHAGLVRPRGVRGCRDSRGQGSWKGQLYFFGSDFGESEILGRQ